MKRYELSIKAVDLPGWDLWAGIREIIQNARDAEIQDGAISKIEFVYRVRDKKPVGTLLVCNEGTTIPLEAFLIGHTSKADCPNLIGKYGEGLKFGILALLRLGLEIKIRNGSQSWNPVICQSKDYCAEVLAFDVSSGNRFEDRVQIEILGITQETWEEIKAKVLWLDPPTPDKVLAVSSGKLLLGPKYAGKIFNKGIWVCDATQLVYGYDFNDAKIDRDRRMVDDLSGLTSNLLSQVLDDKTSQSSIVDGIYTGLRDGSLETSSIYSYLLSSSAIDSLVEKFKEAVGNNAVPVETDAQIEELKSLGITGVRVPYNLKNILSARFESAASLISRLRNNVAKEYEMRECTAEELQNLNIAMSLIERTLADFNNANHSNLINTIQIVDFNDTKVTGNLSEDKQIRIAKRCLKSKATVLRVLIRETANWMQANKLGLADEYKEELTQAILSLLLCDNNASE